MVLPVTTTAELVLVVEGGVVSGGKGLSSAVWVLPYTYSWSWIPVSNYDEFLIACKLGDVPHGRLLSTHHFVFIDSTDFSIHAQTCMCLTPD